MKPKLLDQVRAKIRLRHYSICTEHTYPEYFIKSFLHYE